MGDRQEERKTKHIQEIAPGLENLSQPLEYLAEAGYKTVVEDWPEKFDPAVDQLRSREV